MFLLSLPKICIHRDDNSGERGVWIFHLGSYSNHTILPASGGTLRLDDPVPNTFSTHSTMDHQNSFLDIIENGADLNYDSTEEEQKVKTMVAYKPTSEQNPEESHIVDQVPVVAVNPVQYRRPQYPHHSVLLDTDLDLEVTGNGMRILARVPLINFTSISRSFVRQLYLL